MRVTLDGEPVAHEAQSGETLSALLAAIASRQASDRRLVSVRVNGQLLQDEELSRRLAQPVAGDDTIELGSADARGVVADALREAALHLSESQLARDDLVDLLTSGRMSEAAPRLAEALACWQVCQRTLVEASAFLGRDLTSWAHEDRALGERLRGLADKLRELRDAVEARDWVLVTDLVQYEMSDLASAWRGALTSLADTLGEPSL